MCTHSLPAKAPAPCMCANAATLSAMLRTSASTGNWQTLSIPAHKPSKSFAAEITSAHRFPHSAVLRRMSNGTSFPFNRGFVWISPGRVASIRFCTSVNELQLPGIVPQTWLSKVIMYSKRRQTNFSRDSVSLNT